MRTKKLPAILLALCCLLGACSVQKSEKTPELPEGTVYIYIIYIQVYQFISLPTM